MALSQHNGVRSLPQLEPTILCAQGTTGMQEARARAGIVFSGSLVDSIQFKVAEKDCCVVIIRGDG